jgi:hypothetical protein
MLQGHSNIVQRCNMNSGAQANGDTSESYQRCTGDLGPRGKEGEVLTWPWILQFCDGYYGRRKVNCFLFCLKKQHTLYCVVFLIFDTFDRSAIWNTKSLRVPSYVTRLQDEVHTFLVNSMRDSNDAHFRSSFWHLYVMCKGSPTLQQPLVYPRAVLCIIHLNLNNLTVIFASNIKAYITVRLSEKNKI